MICRSLILVLLATLSTGCLFRSDPDYAQAEDRVPLGRTIAALPEPDVDVTESQAPTRSQVLEAYARVEGRLKDPKDNHAIDRRMAELAMEAGEDAAIEGAENPYAAAIARYEALLGSSLTENRDEVLYQLSHAHDVSGDSVASMRLLDQLLAEYPESSYGIEARFRRAEMHFSAERYAQAADDYAHVVSAGETSSFHQNALYMLGWSEFKQSNLEPSLDHFLTLLGVLSTTDAELTRAETELLDDALRVTVLTLQYLDGPQTLADRMQGLELPSWQHKVYESLAAEYVERERFHDAVTTWSTFVDRNPLDAFAPMAQQELIRVLHAGGFPSDVLRQQEVFVERFGINSPYWSRFAADEKPDYGDVLRDYLNVLASHAHAGAQAKAKEGTATSEDYLAAARWYEESLQTFPDDPAVARNAFLLGELYTEAGDHQRAVAAYQRVAREHKDAPEAADAGYAAILGLGELQRQDKTGGELGLRMQIDAQIEYAMQFRNDARAVTVQAAAANGLFALGEYAQAMELAKNLLESWPEADQGLRETALSIVGHGQFEQQDYAQAEQTYRQLLALSNDTASREKTSERLLAAVYKQGEQAETQADLDTAARHYQRLAEIDGQSELAIRGAFDAVAIREKQGDSAAAATLLDQLRADHPDHALLKDSGVRLASLHERSGERLKAAAELVRLADNHADAEVRRQSRFRAAELYLGENDMQSALLQFERYARTFMDPHPIRMEAMAQLVSVSESLGEPVRRKQWQQELVKAHDAAGSGNTARTTTLAAQAAFALAADDRVAFDSIRLQQPLMQSLKSKQVALENAVAAYERVAGYQVQEYMTAATFQIADLYTSLGQAILHSEQPQDLSPEALEQYVLLLEEEAYPFEEKAIALHEINMRRSWEGIYDDWVKRSFAELKRLMPARFDKPEIETAYVESIH